MKALSLLQPWASLVIMGKKTIETRSWQTTYRGLLLIHASLGKKGQILCTQSPFSTHIKDFRQLPFGAIIGSVLLKDVLPVDRLSVSPSVLASLTLEEKAFGDYTPGRYAWLLKEPVAFHKPIPMKGCLGLWNYMPV